MRVSLRIKLVVYAALSKRINQYHNKQKKAQTDAFYTSWYADLLGHPPYNHDLVLRDFFLSQISWDGNVFKIWRNGWCVHNFLIAVEKCNVNWLLLGVELILVNTRVIFWLSFQKGKCGKFAYINFSIVTIYSKKIPMVLIAGLRHFRLHSSFINFDINNFFIVTKCTYFLVSSYALRNTILPTPNIFFGEQAMEKKLGELCFSVCKY